MKSSTKYLKIIINYICMVMAIFVCIYILPKLILYFMPFVVAFIISLIVNPLVKFLESKIKIKRKAGSVVVVILALGVVVLICYGLISVLVTETSGLISNVPYIWSRITSAFGNLNESMGRFNKMIPKSVNFEIADIGPKITEAVTEWVKSIGQSAAESAGDSVKNLPLTIVGIIMGVLASYSFVAERDTVSEFLDKIIPEETKERMSIVTATMRSAVGGYFKAQFKIMGFVYIVLLIGFIILRIEYSFLIALLVAILDFLPFFGTGTVMWPWALIAFLQKDYKLAIGMMIVWGVSQLVRQVIQPKVLGDSVGMPAIPTLFLLYFGFRISGAIGLIVAVPIGMIVYNLYKAGIFSNFFYSTRIIAKDIKKLRVFTDEELEAEGIVRTDTGVSIKED